MPMADSTWPDCMQSQLVRTPSMRSRIDDWARLTRYRPTWACGRPVAKTTYFAFELPKARPRSFTSLGPPLAVASRSIWMRIRKRIRSAGTQALVSRPGLDGLLADRARPDAMLHGACAKHF